MAVRSALRHGAWLAAATALAACTAASPGVGASQASRPPATAAQAPGGGPVLVAVGDLACPPAWRRTALRCHQAATAAAAARLRPAAIALPGDLQYHRGTFAEFTGSFARTWGRLPGLRPAPGNHEYFTPGAAGYYRYFGARAGPGRRGYYSYDVGSWHVISLNSNCLVVSCARGSAQERWLRADLAAHPNRCVLAYWHHPRFSSGFNGNWPAVAPFWNALYQAGADLVINGHDHSYERFAPQTPTARRDDARGIRQFVVGTGGIDLRRFVGIKPNSQVRHNRTFGVLALALRPDGYAWRFVPEAGRSFSDAGSGSCH